MRTQGNFNADTPHNGGLIWVGASNTNWTLTASLTYTRNAAGDYSLNLGASLGPAYITCALCNVKRLQVYPDLNGMPFQEAFGTSIGGVGYPAGVAGLPPFTGASQLVQPTTTPPKGIQVNSMVAVYLIGGATLTTHTLNLYRTTYANNVANSVTTVALSTNSLTKTVQTNPYVQVVTVTTPIFETTDLTDLIAEVAVTTASSGSYRFYGVGFYCNFNYN